jgi:hypothetical protein
MEKRRGAVRRLAAGLIAGLALPAAACELPAGTRIDSERLALSYRTVPARILSGEYFEVLFSICPKGGFDPVGAVKVDATMPEHRHGMNYRPSVVPIGGGYRSEGWMFHMPGRWEFVFEVGGERLVDSVSIE